MLVNQLLAEGIAVGGQYYWFLSGLKFHGTVILSILVTIAPLLVVSGLARVRGKSFFNTIDVLWSPFQISLQTVNNILISCLGRKYVRPWRPFFIMVYIQILLWNWNIILPLKMVTLPGAEFVSPSTDINVTVALALMVSIAYFYAGIRRKGLGAFKRYVKPTPILLPINLLEDFAKPLSLSFRLFGNVLADDLTVAVFSLLVPLIIPLPIIALGVFAGSVQAVIFTTLAAGYIEEAQE